MSEEKKFFEKKSQPNFTFKNSESPPKSDPFLEILLATVATGGALLIAIWILSNPFATVFLLE